MRLLREPIFHFFLLGAALFLVHRLIFGDLRTITVTSALKAELSRRFQDANGRAPSPAESDAALQQWKRDEALFREALRDHLDRDDPAIRNALVDKMHARAAFEIPTRDPSEADLSNWLGSHRSTYETPLRYDFEFLAFPKTDPAAQTELAQAEHGIQSGATPSTLGRPLLGGALSAAEMNGRIEPELAERIPSMPLGEWQHVETHQSFLLARLKAVTGGLPSLDEVRSRVLADWSFATRQQAIDQSLLRTVARYRFEDRP